MKTAWRLLAVLAVGAANAAPAPPATDPVEEARLAIRTRQYAHALDLLQRLSNAGSADADYLLGLSAWNGVGMGIDRDAARAALERAAGHDHVRAQFALAALLAQGSAQERAAATSWLKRAAAAGYTPAIALRDSGRLPLSDPRTDKGLANDARFEIAAFAARSGNSELLQAVDAPQLASRRDAFGRGLLAIAVQSGSASAVNLLLAGGAPAEAADEFGVTPLMLAVRQPDEQITAALLSAGAKIGTRDQVGRDALNYAATADQAGQARRLLVAGAALDGVDAQGATATDAAQRSQSTQALGALRAAGGHATVPMSVEHGAGIDATRTGVLYAGWPPLLVAAAHDDDADIRRRVAAGTAVDVATARGETALLVAVDARARAAVRALLELRADPRRHDAGGANALQRAARSGDAELLGELVERAAPSRVELAALLAVAIERRDSAAMRLLLGRGAAVEDADESGMRPLARAAQLGDLDMIKLLIDRGAVAGAVDVHGRGALWYAAGSRALPVAELLIGLRVPADAPDRAGVTPLLAAVRAGDERMLRLLIDAGASVDARAVGRDPPLRVAAELGVPAVVDVLLARKPDVDAVDAFGETALMAAARSGNEALCSKLLAAGANPRLRGRDRATAGDIANSRGFTALAKLLRG